MRSGSLTLPSADISSAFGNGLFSATWQPTTPNGTSNDAGSPSGVAAASAAAFVLGGGPPSSGTKLTKAAFESISMSNDMMDPNTTLARTLDYLGLDDPVSQSHLSSAPSASGNNGMPFAMLNTNQGFSGSSSLGNQNISPRSNLLQSNQHLGASFPNPFNRAQTSPRLQGLDAIRTSSSSAAIGNGANGLMPVQTVQSRSRSFTIAVGEVANAIAAVNNAQSLLSSSLGPSSGGRPRSSSMGVGFNNTYISPSDLDYPGISMMHQQQQSRNYSDPLSRSPDGGIILAGMSPEMNRGADVFVSHHIYIYILLSFLRT
jgi:hypothetical protein